ncbi:hypothetical protein Gogos_012644, partial [Gossypium gossypioides]|nr:hypothetical protein [Gossypium gossypioides]
TKALKSDPSPTKNGDLFSIWNFDGKIAFEYIIKATEDFDVKCCIGTGGYGSVYRSILPSGKVVALKKLHRLEAEQQAYDTSFQNEIKFLTEIRQKNITKRVNIVKGVAYALFYMHHDCNPPIVHRDISSNNILLNSELEDFTTDFGTARLLDRDSSNRTAKPKSQPTMKSVSQEFLHIKSPIPMPLHEISLIELKNHEMFMNGGKCMYWAVRFGSPFMNVGSKAWWQKGLGP